MLIEFAVTNYRSIRDEARLSLVAGAGKEHRYTNVLKPAPASSGRQPDILRTAAIYGANAAGKSNLIRAMQTMKGVISNSSRNMNAPLPLEPFAFDKQTRRQPTTFEVTCLVDGVRYQYGFSATREAIHEEWLYAWPLGRTQIWFERHRSKSSVDSFKFGDKLSGDREVWRRATRPDALFLSTAASLNSTQLKPVWDWFHSRLWFVVDGLPLNFTLGYCKGGHTSKVEAFLNAADLAINGIHIKEEKFSPEMLPDDMPLAMKEELAREMADSPMLSASLSHVSHGGQAAEFELDEESIGTQKMLALAGPWLDVLENGRVIVIDELHNSLHTDLVRYLVQRFHGSDGSQTESQLIFSTHDTSILNQEIFRRDQIWFCERDRDLATSLFPLSDFRPRKGQENLERAYLSGRYGALPHVRSSDRPPTHRLRARSGS